MEITLSTLQVTSTRIPTHPFQQSLLSTHKFSLPIQSSILEEPALLLKTSFFINHFSLLKTKYSLVSWSPPAAPHTHSLKSVCCWADGDHDVFKRKQYVAFLGLVFVCVFHISFQAKGCFANPTDSGHTASISLPIVRAFSPRRGEERRGAFRDKSV